MLGHHGSAPVRIGNAAAQFQLDVYGEVADAQYSLVLRNGFADGQQHIVRRVLAVLEQAWRQPDEGIWEIRGPRRHFTYSKVMAWAAFDPAVKLAELAGLDGPHRRWRGHRGRRAIRFPPGAAHRQLPASPFPSGAGQHRATALAAAGAAGGGQPGRATGRLGPRSRTRCHAAASAATLQPAW